ncbi:unnamed protein product, partial [Mesorhabditis spiculigera]
MIFLILLLASPALGAPQAAYQLFALSPFRLDFNGHNLEESHFHGSKRASPLSEAAIASAKGQQVLLLLPQGMPASAALTDALKQKFPEAEEVTVHPRLQKLQDKADEVVAARVEMHKAVDTPQSKWETVVEGSGAEQVAEVSDTVVEVTGVKGIHDVEEEVLSAETKESTATETKEATTASSKESPTSSEEAKELHKQPKEEVQLAKKSPKLSPLEEILVHKLSEDGDVKESADLGKVIEEIRGDGDEKQLDSAEVEPKPTTTITTTTEAPMTTESLVDELPKALNSTISEAVAEEKVEMEVPKKMGNEEREKPNPMQGLMGMDEHSSSSESKTSKIVDGESGEMKAEATEKESAEDKVEPTTLEPVTTTTTGAPVETTTVEVKEKEREKSVFKQIWPTEVVIEGREFYLVPKGARARDYLEPYRGGGYMVKQSADDWFRGLHRQLNEA